MNTQAKTLRIKEIMRFYNLNQKEFAKITKIDKTSVSKILSGKAPCGEGIINKILLAFPNICQKWLLTGDGPMTTAVANKNYEPTFTTTEAQEPTSGLLPIAIEVECPNCGTIIETTSDVVLPVIPTRITRMPNIDLEEFITSHPQEMEEVDLRHIWGKGVFVVKVDTRAMEPEYRQGTRLVLRKLPGLAYARPDGSAYVVDTMLPHTLFRYLSRERDGTYKLSASRESGRDPLWIQESDIQNIYDIVGYFKIGR